MSTNPSSGERVYLIGLQDETLMVGHRPYALHAVSRGRGWLYYRDWGDGRSTLWLSTSAAGWNRLRQRYMAYGATK